MTMESEIYLAMLVYVYAVNVRKNNYKADLLKN